MANYPKEIFKAYDVRGIVGKTLTPEIVEAIGHAIGSEAVKREQRAAVLGDADFLSNAYLGEGGNRALGDRLGDPARNQAVPPDLRQVDGAPFLVPHAGPVRHQG